MTIHHRLQMILCLLAVAAAAAPEARGQDFPDTFVNGEIHTVHSEVLKQDRTLFVYLPRSYEEEDGSYPVHYVTDAPGTSNLFHGLLTTLGSYGGMPPGIVVGLSSDGRERHLHAEKGAAAYLEFLAREVIPFVDANYRTTTFRSVVGHSLGGGFALYAFMRRPDLFRGCIAGSPYPLPHLADMAGRDTGLDDVDGYRFLFTSIGSEDDVATQDLERLERTLAATTPQHVEGRFEVHEGADHLSNLALNMQSGLRALYADWRFRLPDSLSQPAAVLLSRHYGGLTERFGYDVRPGEWDVIYPMMDDLAQRGLFHEAIGVLRYAIELYPQSGQPYAFLARAYLSIGERDSALVNAERALRLDPENEFARRVKGMAEH